MQQPETTLIASVILDDALAKTLDYLIPAELAGKITPGCRVLVPVKTSLRSATVWELKQFSIHANLKSIVKQLSTAPITTPDLLEMARWMSRYYCSPLHKVLTTLLPSSVRGKAKEQSQYFIERCVSEPALAKACSELRQKHPQQATVLDIMLKYPQGLFLSDLLQETSGSQSPINTLVKNNVLQMEKRALDRSIVWEHEYFLTQNKVLSDEQENALSKIIHSVQEGVFSTHLLFGVTGSGKTEVYLQAIEHALQCKKGVIFLIPEIILTSQTIERLKSRFQEKIALLHHRLSPGERLDTWKHILAGTAPIVVGARSALFSPVPDLGLIIVDEEHESSYKQNDESPCYHARDLSIVRAKFCKATVVLGSATPSLESYANAKNGKYILSTLTQRPSHFTLPQVKIVNMKEQYEKNKGFTLFSDPLLTAMKARLKVGEQTLLLLNRRGYHSCQICLSCSHIMKCPHCDMNLTFHLGENILACHLCDFRQLKARTCPSCHKEDQFKFKGAGTELVEKTLHALFPEARMIRMDADTTRKKGSHEELCKQFKSGKADILIGTQMIAKGLHFPMVTLVGVLNADTGLQIPDFRSTEAAFQLLTQAAGRSGRGDLKGEVIVQTLLPEHAVLQHAAKQDFTSFYDEEIEIRKMFAYPPFTHLIKCIVVGEHQEKTLQKAKEIRSFLAKELPSDVELLPITPSGHAKIQDKFRFQFLMKMKQILPIQDKIQLLDRSLKKDKIRLSIDVDPLSTFF
ncbi:MAG: primosomal protein N' [Chlamydiae bacterium]|nr:primosomal protein N' [Chlamydiota bacterium]